MVSFMLVKNLQIQHVFCINTCTLEVNLKLHCHFLKLAQRKNLLSIDTFHFQQMLDLRLIRLQEFFKIGRFIVCRHYHWFGQYLHFTFHLTFAESNSEFRHISSQDAIPINFLFSLSLSFTLNTNLKEKMWFPSLKINCTIWCLMPCFIAFRQCLVKLSVLVPKY